MAANDISGDIRLELYKSLRAEAASYIEKIPGLWFQKFALLGGVVAFALAKREGLAMPIHDAILQISVCILPILAILIDARTLEYSLHARSISLFIAESYAEIPVASRWEQMMWTTSIEHSTIIARSAISVVVTVVPTMAVIILAGLLLDELMDGFPYGTVAYVVAAAYSILTVLVTIFIWRKQGRAFASVAS